MTDQPSLISFRFGPFMSVLPLLTFIVMTAILVIKGAPDVNGMIMAAMLGISLAMFFTHNVAEYSENVFSLMAHLFDHADQHRHAQIFKGAAVTVSALLNP